jgi:hypothetical protein
MYIYVGDGSNVTARILTCHCAGNVEGSALRKHVAECMGFHSRKYVGQVEQSKFVSICQTLARGRRKLQLTSDRVHGNTSCVLHTKKQTRSSGLQSKH